MRHKIYSIAVLLIFLNVSSGMAQHIPPNIPVRSGALPTQGVYSDGIPVSNNLYSFASWAEKIYIQLDSKVYTTDKTIWFKAIVTNAMDHAPTKVSAVLHVDLIDPNEQIVEKKLIRIENGLGDGFFQLSQNYTEGPYLIRAYTEWNRNFDSDFFFKEYIQVYATSSNMEVNPIQNITLIEGQNNEHRVRAMFDPLTIDSLHSKDLTLYISVDDKKDTVSIKKSGKNSYMLDYTVPGNSHFLTLKVHTKNNFNYSRTIILDKDYMDLQFFPESGELVHGLPNLIGFKALDSIGKGKPIEGEILNSKSQVIASFKSNQLGMGSVMVLNVDNKEKYVARILTPAQNGVQKTYPLPAITSRGNVLSVKKNGDKINLKASSNYLVRDSIFVRASCRGKAYFDIKGRLQDGNLEFSLQANILPEGIIAFTMMTTPMNPVAERLYFNERPEGRIQISLAADKQSYAQRELTKLSIETKDKEGTPIDASLSVMVLNKEQGQMQESRENILSYFLLSSDLKGQIEDPGFYFTDEGSSYPDLDALLLTQGWRKYKYTKPEGRILFQAENNLTVGGYVGGTFSQNKEKAGIDLTMMTFGEEHSFQNQTTDSLGRFSFIINEEYGKNIDVLIQSTNKSGKLRAYTINLDSKESPGISFDHIRTVEKPDSIVLAYVSKSIADKKTEDAYIRSTEGIVLDEVIVKARLMTPERKLVEEKYGTPKVVIEGDDIRKKEQKWSYGLYSVLMFNFPDKVKVQSYGNILYASLFNSELTLVVIDGIPVMFYNYKLIPDIPPSEVKSFELIPYAKNFRSIFCEAIPEACVYNPPTVGNVIAIYTYGGKGIFGVKPPVGIGKLSVPVFSTPREFYAPKYEQLKTADWLKPDSRTLVHWEPKLKTDSTGKASAFFYNADNTGMIQVLVEAISSNGEIGYKELNLNIRKRE